MAPSIIDERSGFGSPTRPIKVTLSPSLTDLAFFGDQNLTN